MKNHIEFYEKGSVEIVYGKSSHHFPLHSHESFCVGCILNGEAEFTINNSKCLLKKSMAFILPSNTGISITTDTKYDYITICFKNELKRQVDRIRFNNYFIKMDSQNDMFALCNIFKKDNDESKFLKSILKLISNSIDHNISSQNNASNNIVPLICNYIKENACEKFNLDSLAKEFFISKYHLIRMFKKEMGVTPYQYYIQAKMRIIKTEIFHTQSETNLAMDINLSDESHLCKVFKRQMGISIKDYKNNLTKK